jgi:hypothetical protein
MATPPLRPIPSSLWGIAEPEILDPAALQNDLPIKPPIRPKDHLSPKTLEVRPSSSTRAPTTNASRLWGQVSAGAGLPTWRQFVEGLVGEGASRLLSPGTLRFNAAHSAKEANAVADNVVSAFSSIATR